MTIASFDVDDYICITDIAKTKCGESRAADIIKNWIRNRSTIEFLGTWELMYNLMFKVVEFDHLKCRQDCQRLFYVTIYSNCLFVSISCVFAFLKLVIF